MFDPIIVVGPGRCGTSAVAGVLHHLGIFMGKELVPAHSTNPYGHWEDAEFVRLNDDFAMKRKIGEEEWRAGIAQLIEERRSQNVPWGWKDPRTSQLLPQYLHIVGDAKFIRCRRRAADIESSILKAYDGWTWEQAIQLRQGREDALDRDLRGRTVLEIQYNRLKREREAVVRDLAEYAGIAATDEMLRSAAEFIRPD